MKLLCVFLSTLLMPVMLWADRPIDRKALVERHNFILTRPDPAEIPQVGNGEIAFGIDTTGLQSFYGNTLSQWGWHSSPLPHGKTVDDFQMTEVKVHDHIATYPVSLDGQEEIYWWLRENPHRLNLARFYFLLDEKRVEPEQLTEVNQKLDMWRGLITSTYKLDEVLVTVLTTCHPNLDALAVQVESPLINEGRLSIRIAFPYGHATNKDGANWNAPERHTTQMSLGDQSAVIRRKLDDDRYEVSLGWNSRATLLESSQHTYDLTPSNDTEAFSFVCRFAPRLAGGTQISFEQTLAAATEHWERFWRTGGAIDLSESKDARWKELERRIVLSQYLLAVNEAGSLPPQESGLLNNSGWYGKFHLEMHWWHGAHYQPWGRWDLFDRSLGWYRDILPEARKIARRQGYRGGRWPKMIGPDGRFGPSKTGPWLIWQQPHPLFYAEQNYRVDPSKRTLEKWKEVVFETAEFMASYAYQNEKTGKYELGPWVINAAENNHSTKHETLNPTFELAYWRYGLRIACQWNERMGAPENPKWKEVLENLAPLPVQDGVYVMYEGVPDMWTNYNRSHIDVIGAGAFLPSHGVDAEVLGRTVDKAFEQWNMDSTWGWDFPWLAMAAARAGKPTKAVDALLMPNRKNAYSVCGVNKGGPAASYFPGNGGLLYAVAMMAAGWDGAPETPAPGFPKDGTWIVRHEGLMQAQ